MNILQLGSLAYSHYLDRCAVPCISQTLYPGGWKGLSPTLWSIYPPWNQTKFYLPSGFGRAEGTRESFSYKLTEEWTITKYFRTLFPDAVITELYVVSVYLQPPPILCLWFYSEHQGPQLTTSYIQLSRESCPFQDTLCYAFFKKYLVYFFKLRLKYKSQSMGTEF